MDKLEVDEIVHLFLTGSQDRTMEEWADLVRARRAQGWIRGPETSDGLAHNGHTGQGGN